MSHHHDKNDSDGGIKFGIVVNSLYMLVEFVFGISTGSLALIADASHNLTDTITLTVSFIANRIATREANERQTFGYGRATILAALLNAGIMLIVVGFIVFEAINKLRHPTEIEGGIVALVALVGIAVNGSIAYVLSKRRHDLNIRSAFVDMAFDALSSLAAVISGVIIMLTGARYIDSIVALIIAVLLLYNVIVILREAILILLESTPQYVDGDAVISAIQALDHIQLVDDLHIWTIRSGYNALSCHIVIDKDDISESRSIVEEVKTLLRKDFNIEHTTIEVEFEDCTKRDIHERHL